MNSNQPTTDSTEILDRIDRFNYDADWTIEELQEALRAEGIDPDLALERIKSNLAPIYKFKEAPLVEKKAVDENNQKTVNSITGILEAIKQIDLSKERFLKLTGLSDTLLIKIDRRLISLEGFTRVAKVIADALQTTKEAVLDYSNGNTLYPAEANFKAETAPELPPKQSFADAVENDPLLKDDEKEKLLSLRDEN